MNNNLRFLVSSLIMLGGYTTASDCMEIDDNNLEIEDNNQVNQNNNYLVELCNQNKVDVDENGNILENARFLNDKHYFKEISSKIQHIIIENLGSKISENTYHNFTVFLRYVNELCNDEYLNSFFTHNVQNTIIPLNKKFPQLIKLDKGYGDNITLNQLQNYLKNKMRLLLIQCCNEIINNQTNKDKSELENLVINKAKNLYRDVKSILIWLPDFFINTLHIDEQNFTLRNSLTITHIVEYAMYLLNKDGNIIAEEDEDLMPSYEYCFFMSTFRERFDDFLKENSTDISQNTLSILSDINKGLGINSKINNLGSIINIIGNIQLSRTVLNNTLPGIITLNTNSKNGDNISLLQFICYLGNKIELLFIQCRANICNKNREFNRYKDKKILEDIIKKETKIFYEKFNKIISWLPEFLREKGVPEDVLTMYITELNRTIKQINSIMLITNKDDNGNINIKENNNFLLYKYYIENIYFRMRDEFCDDFKNINNWFKFYDMYELFEVLNFGGYNNPLISNRFYNLLCYVNKTQLLPNNLKQKFYNIITLPMEHNSDISVLRALTYLSNKFQLLLINCFNEMQQYIKECKNDTKEYKKLNDRIKMKRIQKIMNYKKQILNIMNWLRDFLTEELNSFPNLKALLEEYRKWKAHHDDVDYNAIKCGNLNEDLQLVNDIINQLTNLNHSVLSFDMDFDKIMKKFELELSNKLSIIMNDKTKTNNNNGANKMVDNKTVHNNNEIIEDEGFVTRNFESLLLKDISDEFSDIFQDTYHSGKYSSIPRIGEWSDEIAGLINGFIKCAQRCSNPINAILDAFIEDYPEFTVLLSKEINRKELNIKFKSILKEIENNIPNIIVDNKDFIYIGNENDKTGRGMEIGNPKTITLLQLLRYCSNKILKEELNTLSRIMYDYKNDKEPDNFKQILKNNMLIGCKKIKSIMCAILEFLKTEPFEYYINAQYTGSEDLQSVYNSITKEIECLDSVIPQIDKFITKYKLEDKY